MSGAVNTLIGFCQKRANLRSRNRINFGRQEVKGVASIQDNGARLYVPNASNRFSRRQNQFPFVFCIYATPFFATRTIADQIASVSLWRFPGFTTHNHRCTGAASSTALHCCTLPMHPPLIGTGL